MFGFIFLRIFCQSPYKKRANPSLNLEMCLTSFSCISLLQISPLNLWNQMWSHKFNCGFAYLLYGEDQQKMCKWIKPNISFEFMRPVTCRFHILKGKFAKKIYMCAREWHQTRLDKKCSPHRKQGQISTKKRSRRKNWRPIKYLLGHPEGEDEDNSSGTVDWFPNFLATFCRMCMASSKPS